MSLSLLTQKLPPELLSDILLLTDPYCVSIKFVVAQVSRYWRAVALSTGVLWATFEIDTTRTAHALPLLIWRAGADTPLDIRLTFVNTSPVGSPSRSLDLANRALAVQHLSQRTVVSRIRALEIIYDSGGVLRRLIGSDLVFPRLLRLQVARTPTAQVDSIPIALDAPHLRYLHLFRSAPPRAWEKLLGPEMEDLRVEHCGSDAHWGVLTAVFRHCRRLKRLALCSYDSSPLSEARDLYLARRSASASGSGSSSANSMHAPQPLRIPAPAAIDSDDDNRSMLRDLTSFQLELPTSPLGAGQILSAMADAHIMPNTICSCVKTGFFVPATANLFRSLLRGLAPLRSLTLETVRDLTLSDALGRERCVNVRDVYGAWEMPAVWRFLTKEYDAHHSMKKFVVDTHAWALLADALAVVPPASSHNPPASPRAIEPASGDSSARSSSPSSSDVELVVRPHYKLVARGEPESDLRRSASPPARDVGMRRTDEPENEEYLNSSEFSVQVDDAGELLASARAADALVDPKDEDLARKWTTRMLVIPNIHKVKVDVTWAVSYAQQRRGALRVLQWVQARSQAARHRLNAAAVGGRRQTTEVCVNFVELLDHRDTRALELRRLAAQLDADGRGFTLCGHCWDWLESNV